jgi:hypothetical protein
MRRLVWQCLPGTTERIVGIDDLVLATRIRELVAPTRDRNGLTALERGARLHVRLPRGDRLTFHGGVLQAWRLPSGGNLAAGHGFGPWPILLKESWLAAPFEAVETFLETDLAAIQPAAHSASNVLEATPLRIVVAGERRLPATLCGDDAPAENLPLHTWRYTIYADGRVYCQIASTPGPLRWSCPRVGYVTLCDSRSDLVLAPRPPQAPESVSPAYVSLHSANRAASALTWSAVPASAIHAVQALPLDVRRELAVLGGTLPAAETLITSHLFLLESDPRPGHAQLVAAAYVQPHLPEVTLGALRGDVAGDLDGDGFNEREGCYELVAHRERARFEFQPPVLPVSSPVFRIHDSANKDAVVHCNGAALPADGRDASGNVLFLLPAGVPGSQQVEVFLTPRPARAD